MRPGRVVTGTTGHQCGYIDLTITRLLLGRISRNAKFYHQVVHNASEYEGRADVGDPGERKKKTSADRFVRFLTPTVNMPKQIREVSILVFVVRVSRNPLSLPRIFLSSSYRTPSSVPPTGGILHLGPIQNPSFADCPDSCQPAPDQQEWCRLGRMAHHRA